jgi:hypothetical protein
VASVSIAYGQTCAGHSGAMHNTIDVKDNVGLFAFGRLQAWSDMLVHRLVQRLATTHGRSVGWVVLPNLRAKNMRARFLETLNWCRHRQAIECDQHISPLCLRGPRNSFPLLWRDTTNSAQVVDQNPAAIFDTGREDRCAYTCPCCASLLRISAK